MAQRIVHRPQRFITDHRNVRPAMLLLSVLVMVLTACAPAKVTSDIDLSGHLISGAEAGAAGFQFDRSDVTAMDIAEVAHSQYANQQRIGDQILQGEFAFYKSTDVRIGLTIRLIEMSNHHWADTIRSKATEPTPKGFPDSTRILVNDDGTWRLGLNMVKGRIQIIVIAQTLKGPDVDRPTLDRLLAHVATVQLERTPQLGDLSSSERIDISDLRAWLIGLQVASIPLLAIILGASASLRDIGSLERLFRARLRSKRLTFYDLTPDVRQVRRQGARRIALQALLATAFGALALALQVYVIKGSVWGDLAIVPVCFAAAIVLDVVLRSRTSAESPGAPRGRMPLIIGTVGAMVVITVVAFWISAAISFMVMFNGSVLIKFALGTVLIVLGFKALRYSAVPFRFAKRLANPDVQEALRTDPRAEILLLRSFQDDALTMRMHRSARHSPIELASAESNERFEELLAWSLWRFGPVFAIGQPETDQQLQPLGAAREFYDDDTWESAVRLRMLRSSMVVFVVGRSPGLYTEFIKAQRLGVIAKCLFVFPPVDYRELRSRLVVLEAALGLPCGSIPPIDADGRRLIGMYIGDNGFPVAVGVDGRDDLAYHTLFTVAASFLIQRADEQTRCATGPGPDQPGPEAGAQLVKFNPQLDYTSNTTVWQGLTYLFLMATRSRQIEWQDGQPERESRPSAPGG
ncbi:hypothetical protein ACPCIR_05900 [Mycobacterium sp. NPDC051198]